MAIVNVADGSVVDTTHIEQLAAAINASVFEIFGASTLLTGAAAQLVATMQIPAAERVRQLLHGPRSLQHLSERIAHLQRALQRAKSVYEESENHLASILDPSHRQGAHVPIFLTPTTLGPFMSAEWLMWLFVDHSLAPGIATQRRVARVATAGLPVSGFINLTLTGTLGSRQRSATQHFAAALSAALGLSHIHGNVAITSVGSRNFQLLSGADPKADVLSQVGSPRARVAEVDLRTTIQQLVPYLIGGPPTSYQATASGISSYVGTLGRLNRLSQQRQEMMIQIDHVLAGDNTEVWVVHIPGTSAGMKLGSANPSNHDANPMLLAGEQTDVQRAVKAAMEQAGVAAGAKVVLTGHSQGGLAAMNLARDEAFRHRYHLTNVLTCGSPVGGLPVDSQVRTLHLENLSDHIPGLDGEPNEASPSHVTVQFTNSDMGLLPEPDAHGMRGYQQAVKEMAESNDPRVRLPLQNFVAAVGFVGGGRVTSRLFAATRTKPVKRNDGR